MSQSPAADRADDIRHELAEEFARIIPMTTVDQCLKESFLAYNEARIRDFVPLLVRRETRARLARIARQESRVAV